MPKPAPAVGLREIASNLDEAGVSRDFVVGEPEGLSPEDARALYAIAQQVAGPILEVRRATGAATLCIAQGLRDSGCRAPFLTTTVAGGGPKGMRERLIAANLADIVTVVDHGLATVPDLDFRLIVCDSGPSHRPTDVASKIRALKPLVRERAIIVWRGVAAAGTQAVSRELSLSETHRVGSLLIGRVTGPQSPVTTSENIGMAPAPRAGSRRSLTSSAQAPLVSVLLPTYNRAHLLPRAMLSVLRQTFTDFELIIVDDGSTDATPGVVAAFDDPRIQYIRRGRNGGVSVARNAGLHAGRGRYVAFIDSDDEWLPEKLAREVRSMTRAPAATGVVYSSFWLIKAGRRIHIPSGITRLASRLPSRTRALDGEIAVSLQRGNFIALHAALIRQACFDKIGDFDEALPGFEDWDLWLRISAHFEFRYIPIPGSYKYRPHDSLTHDAGVSSFAFRHLLDKHGSGEGNEELRAHLLFIEGNRLCREGQLQAGRQILHQACRLRPANALYAATLIAARLGARCYRVFSGLTGRLLP